MEKIWKEKQISYLLVQWVIWATWIEGISSSPVHGLLLATVTATAVTAREQEKTQQQAEGIKQLFLSCYGFWPFPPRQSKILLCHMQNQRDHMELLQGQQTKVSSHSYESGGFTVMQGLGPKQTQAWV